MIGCSSKTVTDPDELARDPRASINIVLTGSGDFEARLTWVDLPCLSLARIRESLPRVAFVALAPGRIFVSFPTHYRSPVIWNGVEMRRGDIVLHSDGDRIHQRTSGASHWGLISLTADVLAYYGSVLAHVDLTPPHSAQFLRPPATFAKELLHVHAQACRLAESKPERMAHKEVARACEQDLLPALIDCLVADDTHRIRGARRRHAGIMARFEDILSSRSHEQLQIPQLCSAVGVSESTLRMCCQEILGMSPTTYARLRRLNLVRALLRRADPATAGVAEVARHHGFSELGRFATIYRSVFGETPSTTLRAARSPSYLKFKEFA